MLMLGSLADEFLTHLSVERRVSANTIRAYRRDLATFIQFLHGRGVAPEVATVSPTLLREYLAHLSSRGLSVATIRRRFHGLRSFWAYLCDWHEVASNPFRRITLPKALHGTPVFLSPEEVRLLLEAAEDTPFVVRGIRDRAVLTLLVYTGLRRQELLDLELADVDLDDAILRVRHGKGARGRIVPLRPEAVQAIRDWLELRPPSPHPSLFLNHLRLPLGIKGIPWCPETRPAPREPYPGIVAALTGVSSALDMGITLQKRERRPEAPPKGLIW